MTDEDPSPPTPGPPVESVQDLVDALSVALRHPVLLDDPALVPLAYSRQWGEIDTVRSESILSRGPTTPVRDALLGQGIAAADEPVRIAADRALGMTERVCVPVRRDGELLGYVWLLDHQGWLGPEDLRRVEQGAERIAELLAASARRPVGDEGPLLAGLWASSAVARERAAAEVEARRLLVSGPLVVCLLSPRSSAVDVAVLARRAARRLSTGHAIAGATPDGAALLAMTTDPVLATLPADEIATWLQLIAGPDVVIGQSAVASALETLPEAHRQAGVALRVARARPERATHVAWATLGADRLVAQLPGAALADLPPGLRRLLADEPGLVTTLAAFLEAGGDVKATATALSLHRSGLYYRLGRIEELTGLDLGRGDDRLLAHLAIRLARLS